MAARWDLVNLLKREGKHQLGRVDWAVVEDEADGGNIFGEEDPSQQLLRAEEMQQWQAVLATVAATFTEVERRVLELMFDGERNTAVYAQSLRMGALSTAEQEREVKRMKDRIKKRLQRGVVGHG
jgi:DNA-directed RNA polymerase specialized sigma subunit